MVPARRLAVACATVALLVTGAPTASADTHSKLRHERHRAAQLDAKARHQALLLAGSRRTLDRLDAQANAALALLQRATLSADSARADSDAALLQLANARADTAGARDRLDALAAGAYRTMAAGGAIGTTLSLVETGDAQSFVDGLQMLGQVGKSQASVVDDLRVAEARQLRSEHLATAATARAVAAERGATIAKQHVDALVAEQRQEVSREHTQLSHIRTAASHAHARASALARRIAAAEARAAAIRRAQANALAHFVGPLAACNGGSVSGYGNGQLPVSALCSLWDAPGMMLRSAAAAAFNRMSQAYAHVFGSPMCVTSSYRAYQRQVELYATMPAGYAAVPGTSNHGWGLAVDLCGGVQVDNSPEHNWLLDHAPSYSWFHPAWALPGGPGPHEPWHWEYAG
jgi:LAS superfamily LD-carboxypeptidase LdcB